MMPVMADAANFSALAAPLSPTEAKPFMISMEPEVEGGDAVRYSNPRASRDVGDMPGGGEAVAEEEALPGLTEADFVPIARGVDGGEEPPLMSEEKARQENEVQGATEALAAAALIGAAAAVGAEAVSSVAKTESAPTDVVPSDAPEDKAAKANVADDVDKDFKVAANAAAPADPAAAAAAAAFATALTDPSAQAATTPTGKPDDKLNNFVNFLQGDNPGACMFHAQMRLSLEGCKKLADFVAGSSRVRALSLSHNFIGDDGLFVLCQGLKLNASVTSLELPSNNIGNKGVSDLCEAVKKNPALTQLQLSNNKIGDEGAVSLAEFIKKTSALKKLGLSNNSVGKTGCHALIEALKVNSSIIQLQILPGNPVEEKDAKKLQKALLKKEKKFSIGGFLSQFNY